MKLILEMIAFFSINRKSKIYETIVKLNNFENYKCSNLGNDRILFN